MQVNTGTVMILALTRFSWAEIVDRRWVVTERVGRRMLRMCDLETLFLLLPQLAAVDVTSVAVVDGVLVVVASTHAGLAWCTGCGQPSDWVHSA
jgi:hypothetical protein